MGFYISDAIYRKQYLNLSSTALATIENDMMSFQCPSKNLFINNLFQRFHETANASIYKRLELEKQKLSDILSPLDKQAADNCLTVLLSHKEKELRQLAGSYEKGIGIRIRINDDNFLYLTEDPDCKEDKYYDGHVGHYLKALIEEYCRLPFTQRELVYFSDTAGTINQAIDNHLMLQLKTRNGNTHYVRPYCLTSDVLSLSHYLIGIRVSNSEIYKDSSVSFRLDNITSCKILNRSGFLSESSRKTLDKELENKGCQFMSSDINEIVVELTPNGIRSFNSRRNMRPTCIRQEGNRYVFNCTETQVMFYFFNFGEDAVILQPLSLARRFREKYLHSAERYKSLEKEDG